MNVICNLQTRIIIICFIFLIIETWTLQPPLQLRELPVSSSSFSEIPNSLSHLQHLEKFKLIGYESSALPEEFCFSRSLQYLELKYSYDLRRLPDSFGNLRNLKSISLKKCIRLEVLPDSIKYLSELQRINLDGCKSLEVLPNALGTLTNLREINLSGCKKLKMLPKFYHNLINSQAIILAGCKSLEMLPNSIGELTNLQEINVDSVDSKCLDLHIVRVESSSCFSTALHSLCVRVDEYQGFHSIF